MLCAGAFILSRRSGGHLVLLLSAIATGMAGATSQRAVVVPPTTDQSGWHTLLGEVDASDDRRADLKVASVDGAPAHFRARLWDAKALPGQQVMLQARLKKLDGPANPGERFGERALRQGRWYSGTVRPASLLSLTPPSRFERWRATQTAALTKAVERVAPSTDAAHLYLALAAGRRADLGEALESDFARSGLAHVLSVSGLHVAALGVFALAVMRRLAVRLPGRRVRRVDPRVLAVLPALLLLWGYVAFTGSEAPAVRSGVMTTALMIGLTLQRRSAPLNALAIAAAALLVVDPSSVADLSCQLSVLSAIGLILISPALRQALPVGRPDPASSPWRWRWQKLRETSLQALCASAAVMVLTTPLLAQTFQRMGFAGLVSNVVSLPLCGAVSVLAAAGAALFVTLPSLATPVLWAGTWSCELLNLVASLFAKLPLASVDVPSPPTWLAVGWMVGALGFSLVDGRWRWAFGALVPAAAFWLVAGPHLTPHAPLEVTFLAVGHGDAIVVQSQGHTALIDGGGVPGGSDTGERFVVPFLRRQGVRGLDLVALSHPHPDHALGLISTLQRHRTERLWLPAGAGEGPLVKGLREAAVGATVDEVELGHAPLQLGEATIEVLGPPVDRVLLESENDRSLVLRLRHGDVTFLLTGDLEEAGEAVLEPGEVTVMKAPHHGSRTSSTDELLQRAKPKHVVFCVGVRNRFGFPHREVVERYEALGARCHRTDRDGAITFRSDGHEVSVDTFRQLRQTGE